MDQGEGGKEFLLYVLSCYEGCSPKQHFHNPRDEILSMNLEKVSQRIVYHTVTVPRIFTPMHYSYT